MAIDPGATGRCADPVHVRWTVDETLLYAVSVGAGQEPLDELALTTENSEGVDQQVVPLFAAVLSQRAARPDIGDFDRSKLVHAEQHLEVHRPLAPEGSAFVTARVGEIFDKGKGALVWTEAEGLDEDGGRLFSARSAAYIRGAGGFGGQRGSSEEWSAPQRPADAVVPLRLRPEQALLYRLNGDHNPLHSDPAFADRGGFDRPILHGMCTLGFSCRALVAAVADGDAGALTRIGGRFVNPVLPGDTLSLQIWREGDEVWFRTLRSDGSPAVDRGTARVRRTTTREGASR